MKANLLREKAKIVLTEMKSFGYLLITRDQAFLGIDEISRNRAHVNENANMQAVAKNSASTRVIFARKGQISRALLN